MKIVEYKTQGETTFHVPEGLYTIKQLEMLIKEFQIAEKRMRNHLTASMGRVSKEKNERQSFNKNLDRNAKDPK